MNRRNFLRTMTGTVVGLSSGLNPLWAKKGSSAKRPNLLFIMTDQQRFDALSIAGNKVLKTPNMDRIGREGAYFTICNSQCPVCGPA
ncbi:MAG: sulfatase-like hydrolase/transferase [bacterium]|nr:sulfatase-like hydrolase/transferase [bacterium]